MFVSKALRNMGVAAVIAFAATMTSAKASLLYTFVGSWTVDSGPYWVPEPTGYTGQEVAALLFGGAATDYVISTVNALDSIDFSAWVSTWGGACAGNYPCGTIVAQDFKVSTDGLYATEGDTSAYVRDWAIGEQFTNYAFRVTDVPGPVAGAGIPALIAGGVWLARRRSGKTA